MIIKNAVINAVKKEMRVPFADVDATAGAIQRGGTATSRFISGALDKAASSRRTPRA